MARLSLQLYTLRDLFDSDRDATFAAIASMGLDEVEPFGIEHFDWLPGTLAEHGLSAGSAHADVIGAPDQVLAAARTLGVHTVFQPGSDRGAWLSGEGIASVAASINAQVGKFADAGVTIGYHNHEFEFVAPEVDGVPAYDHFVSLLDPRVALEVDTYWAVAGGRRPLDLFEAYGDRITHLHVKDGPLGPSVHDQANVVLGEGAMDLPPILAASPNRTWVLEFDQCGPDPLDEVRRSIDHLAASTTEKEARR